MNYLTSLRRQRKHEDAARSRTLALHYGDSRTPLAHIVPDEKWPGMFRVAWPDGLLSDMANLSRAKDAAAVIAGRSMPGHKPSLFRWSREPVRRPLVRSKHRDHSEVADGWIDWPETHEPSGAA